MRPLNRNCERCGMAFRVAAGRQRWCSSHCRNRALKRRPLSAEEQRTRALADEIISGGWFPRQEPNA